jgi:hypothetical protein
VYSGERRKLAVAQSMAALVMQRQLTVPPLHPGTAALKAVGAVAGDLFQVRALGRRQGVERMGAVAQRFEQLAAQRSQSVPRLGMGAARGDALQIQGGNQLFDEGALQVGWERKGLDLQLQGGKEKGEGGQQLGGQTLRFGQTFTGARRQVSGRGDTPELRPDAVESLCDLFDRLCLSALQVIRVIQDAELSHQSPGFALTRLRQGVRDGAPTRNRTTT